MTEGIQVLYVDDEDLLLDIGKRFLENNGEFSVDTALSASVALDILNKKTYDAIVSDFQMPESDGIELLKRVRAFNKSIPFILFTGRGREEIVIDAINNGADFYIQKGGDPTAQFAELAHKIRQSVLMRRTQVTIAEQEQRYHDLQNANDLIQSVAPDGHFLFVNKKWLDTLGYAEEELANLTIFDIIHEESIKHCMETFQRVISGENIGIIDATFRTRDGVKVYVEGMANCKLVEGACQYTRGIFKDVTLRRKAELELLQKNEDLNAAYEELTATEEELRYNFDLLSQKEQALRESEEKYRLLTEVTDDVIYMIDLDGTITHISPQIARYGYKPEEILSHNFAEFIAEADVPNVVADFKAVIKTRKQMVTTIRIRDKAGNLHWMEDNGAPVYDSSGSVVAISGILRDISGRRKAEEALTESEEKFRSIFEHSPYPIAINSLPDNKFIEVNKAFLDISEYTEAEIIGKDPIGMGFLPLTEALKLISHRLLTGKIENVPLAVTAKGGKRVHVLFSTMPITINNKPAIVTVTAEVTKLKRVEEELLRKNEDLNAAYEELTATDEELRANYDELSKKEEVIRASEEKFRVLVEFSLDGIIITDFLGKLLFANRAAGLIVDAPDYEAMIGKKNVLDFVAPESKVDVLRDFGKVALGIDAYLVNYKLISQKKRDVWVECIGKKIPFGGSSAMLVSMRDVTERKRHEESVRESENKFATIFRNSPVSLTLVSATDGTFIDVNDAFLRSTGYSRHEVVGSFAVTLGIFADKSEYKRFSTILRNQRTVHGMEMKCRIKNGEIRTCRFSSGIIMMDAKPHILSTVDDITEQKATELALQALVRSMVGTTGLDSLKKITENVSSWLGADCVMVGEIQPDRQTVKVLSMLLDGNEVHDFSYTLKGTPCENVADKGFCVYPDNAIALFPESKDLVELKIRGYIGTPLRNSEGHVIGILCALSRVPLTSTPTIQEIVDIIAVKAAAEVERIQIERALHESELLFREVFDNANDSIFLVERARDGPGKYLLVNNKAVQMLGYSKEELLEMSPRNIVPEDIAKKIMPEVIKKLVREGQATFESGNRRKDGSIIPIEVSIRAFRYKGKDVDLSIVRDITERRKIEETLRQSEEKFRKVFENSPLAITLATPDFRFHSVNPAWISMTGYSEEELLKMSFKDITHPDYLAGDLEHIQDLEAGTIPAYSTEKRYIRKDKSILWGFLRVVPIRDQHGPLRFFAAQIEDITERKQAVAALRESEERFKLISERSPDHIIIQDLNLRYLWVLNPQLGLKIDDMIGKTDYDILNKEDADNLTRVKKQVLEKGTVVPFETSLVSLHGEREYFDGLFQPKFDKDGKINGLMGYFRNVTSQKLIEIALRQSEEKFRSFVENANDVIYSMTPDGIVTYVSPRWTDVLGYDTSEILGKSFELILPPEELPAAHEFLRQILMGEINKNGIEYQVRHKDGTLQWHNSTVSPVRDSKGNIVSFLGISHDITERKRDVEALRQANKKLNILSGITRHDIKNQLLTLDGFLALLHNKIPDPSLEHFFSRINRASNQITNMIQFTKEYEKIGVHAPTWQDIRILVDSVRKNNTPDQITLKNDLPANTEIFADPLITKVFFNLIDNAVRHGGKITTIRFSLEEQDGDRIIVCADDGDGVASGEKEMIFKLGFGKNTGFGLAISREILDITGITIKETGEPGKGARFEIAVPKNQIRSAS